MSIVLPIEQDLRFRRYTASAGQTQFAVPFPFQQDGDIVLKLLLEDGTYGEVSKTLYTLTGAGSPSGGMAVFSTGRAAGDVILVLGQATLDRLSSIVQDGRFKSKITDDELDRNRIIQQELRRDIDRAMKAPFGQPALSVPEAAEGRALGWSGGVLTNIDVGLPALAQKADKTSPTIFRSDNPSIASITLALSDDGRSDINFGSWLLGRAQDGAGSYTYLYNGVKNSVPLRILADDQMLSYLYVDGLIPGGNGYDKRPTPQNIFAIYGQNDPVTTGTLIASRREAIIYNSATPAAGKNEFAADYAVMSVRGGVGNIAPGGTYWNGDNHWVGPESAVAANSPHFGVGRSLRMINFAIGLDNPNGTRKGSWGYAAGGLPTDAPTNVANGNTPTARTYPILSVYQAYGFSGAPGVTDGAAAGADYFAIVGFRVGGIGGGPYADYATSSKFKTAFEANDFTDTGLLINRRLPGAAGPGIWNKYESWFGGVGIPTKAGDSVLFEHNSYVDPGNGKISRHVSLRFGSDANSWALFRDIAGDGDHNFGVFSTLAGKHLILFGGAGGGGVAFNGVYAVAPPVLPAAATDAATTQALANAMRSLLINNGLGKVA